MKLCHVKALHSVLVELHISALYCWYRLDEDNSVVIPNMPLGRNLPPKPAARWKQTKVTIQNKARSLLLTANKAADSTTGSGMCTHPV